MSTDVSRRQALSCLLPSFRGLEAPRWVLDLCREGLGGVVVFGGNVASPGQLSELCARLGAGRPELILAMDEEGGDVTRLHMATGAWAPGNRALGAVDDVSATEDVAREMARELRACGLTMTLAPGADVAADERNPVVGVRSFGADPALVARHSAAFVSAVQREGIAACAKHFPGHGGTHGDSHRALPTVDATEATVRRRDLPPFQAAIDAGVLAVMTAHVCVPAFDPQPATHSARILTRLLREEMGFEGVVVSDALDMAGASGGIGVAGAAVRALAAGVDALCLGPQPDRADVLAIRDVIVDAVEREELDIARLASAARRVAALGAWTAHRDASGTCAPNPRVGLAAARRALSVRGDARLSVPPIVLELRPEPTIPAGRAHWGIADTLAALWPATRAQLVDGPQPPGAVSDALASHQQRPVVVVLRDSARNDWELGLLHEALSARPDAVVVELGVPGELPPVAALVITHGASLSSSLAATEALTGATVVAPPPFVPPSARTAARVESR